MALAMAAASAGTLIPCASIFTPLGAAVIWAVAGAPVMRNSASTLPTRSTTAITAGCPSALACVAACAITCCTSEVVSATLAGAV